MHVAHHAQVANDLQAALPDLVEVDPFELSIYTTDRSGHRSSGSPVAAVSPRTIEDVQTVCRIATATGSSVVTRGAGTGLAGGSVAGPGEIVLLMDRMNEILEISVDNRLAVVQPGIINGHLNAALAEHGLWWAPDPASKDISTVGGNIAMNAGGLLCAKYGVTRESVLALKVVLADGRLLSVGHRTVKGVTGYDLCSLIIGSEGTLGVIVECTLKVQPLVEGPVATIGAFFDTVRNGAAAAAAITKNGHNPAIMELMDGRTIEYVGRYLGEVFPPEVGAYLLIQCDGPAIKETAPRIAGLIRSVGGTVEITTNPAESQRLLNFRRSAFPALESLGTLLVEDIAVPRDKLPAAFDAISRLERKYDLIIPTTCHAGDGNLHPTFIYNGDAVPDRIWKAAGELFTHALELGGTLTGEHGIGLLKRDWLEEELGRDQLQLQRQIKAVFDPDNLLNPGKIFVT
jgi:glycolate oxidase